MIGVFVISFFLAAKAGATTKQVYSHALNRADVDERVTRLRVQKIGSGQHLWIERFVFANVFAVKSLAVDLVDSVELQSRFRLERSESADCLSGERSAINQEKNAPCEAGLQQPVQLVDRARVRFGAVELQFLGPDGFIEYLKKLQGA